MRCRALMVFGQALILTCGAVWAEPGKVASTNDTVITSRTLTFDYQRFIGVFDGDVVVVDPQIRIDADQLVVAFDKDNRIKSATATGNVRLRRDDKTGTCEKAIYLARTGEVMLLTHATLMRGQDEVRGDKITFYMNDDRMTCEPGYLIITPQKGKDLPE